MWTRVGSNYPHESGPFLYAACVMSLGHSTVVRPPNKHILYYFLKESVVSFELTVSVERCRGQWKEETLSGHIARCVGMKGGIFSLPKL